MLTCDRLVLQQGDFVLKADFQFAADGITALIGPSGAGKSTLLAALAGFLEPESGQVLWQGQDLTHVAPGLRPMSILFQDNNLFPHLTIGQNIGLALRPNLRLDEQQNRRVDEVLERVGLSGFHNRKPAALSGGQQSRAALARVLISDRPVVLLDEPFAALGPGLRGEMLDLVQDKLSANGRILVMVTHDPADAKRVADQVVLVVAGQAYQPVATADLFANPPDTLSQYLGVG